MLKSMSAGAVLAAAMIAVPTSTPGAPVKGLQQRIEAAYTAEISPALLPDGVERTRQLHQEAEHDRRLLPADRARAAMLYANAIWEKGDGKAPLALMTGVVKDLRRAEKGIEV